MVQLQKSKGVAGYRSCVCSILYKFKTHKISLGFFTVTNGKVVAHQAVFQAESEACCCGC